MTMMREITKKKIQEQTIYVGLDVHYKQWNISVVGAEDVYIRGMSIVADAKTLVEFLKRKFTCETIHLAYEAGFCGFHTQRELEKEGIKAIVVNAADIPTSDKDGKQKTDKRDSFKIAQSLRANMLEAIYVPSQEDEENQGLFRRRTDLVRKQIRIKNQIKSLLKKYGIKPEGKYEETKAWTKTYIKWLAEVAKSLSRIRNQIESMLRELDFLFEEIKIVEQQLAELSQCESYKYRYNQLIKISGIGKTVAMAIILELFDINRFECFPRLASYVGFIPREHSSGEKQRLGSMTKRSRTRLKTLLIESAWITISKDEAFREYYKRLLTRMESQEAIIRCAKKLLRRIYHILKTGEEYQCGFAA
jgi:transposase